MLTIPSVPSRLVGAFSVIVKTDFCRWFVCSSSTLWAAPVHNAGVSIRHAADKHRPFAHWDHSDQINLSSVIAVLGADAAIPRYGDMMWWYSLCTSICVRCMRSTCQLCIWWCKIMMIIIMYLWDREIKCYFSSKDLFLIIRIITKVGCYRLHGSMALPTLAEGFSSEWINTLEHDVNFSYNN